jgi:hypothetical protein
MKVTVNVPGIKYVKHYADNVVAKTTKAHVIRKIQGTLVAGFGMYGTGFVASAHKDRDFVRVYNIEKRRKVVKVVTDPKKLKKGIKREIVTPSHWVVTYYDFPLELLKVAKIRVVQGTRTFKIESLKKG